MLKNKYGFAVGFFLLITWLFWPVYQFYAHRGAAPFVPWGWLETPVEAPKNQNIYRPIYKNAGEQALQVMAQHRQQINAPGISAAVSIDGEVVWAGGAGWADIENNRAVTQNTQFRVGSTSKAITATGLGILIDQKVIDLNAFIPLYHNSLPNPSWHKIKVKHLASHLSGLTHYKQFDDLFGLYETLALNSYYSDVNEALTLFDETKLKFEPGTEFSYSSYGTVLLSAVIQAAANQPFQQFMDEQVFMPLELNATGEESKFVGADQLSTFYWTSNDNHKRIRVWRDVDLSHRLAGGGFVSTSSELVKLGSAYFDEQFISNKTVQSLWTPQLLSNGEINPQNYGIGWRIHQFKVDNKDVAYMHHGGVSRGAQSWLAVIPEYKLSFALNINTKTKTFKDFYKIWKEIVVPFIEVRESSRLSKN